MPFEVSVLFDLMAFAIAEVFFCFPGVTPKGMSTNGVLLVDGFCGWKSDCSFSGTIGSSLPSESSRGWMYGEENGLEACKEGGGDAGYMFGLSL